MGVPAGTDGSVMTTGAPVVNTVLPVAAALTNGDGNPPVSADHPGDDDEIAAPPAFTAATTPAGGGGGPVPETAVPETATATALVPEWATVAVADSAPTVLGS